jgi:hypothetical protein
MKYEYYVKSVNQQPGGKIQKFIHCNLTKIFYLEINNTFANESVVSKFAFAGDAGN